jgi:hypothetical protein
LADGEVQEKLLSAFAKTHPVGTPGVDELEQLKAAFAEWRLG